METSTLEYCLILYLLIINIVAFAAFGIDKMKARRGSWRISEKALFGLAFAGGSLGALAAMNVFRHKTKHKSFVIGIPVIMVLQVVGIYIMRVDL